MASRLTCGPNPPLRRQPVQLPTVTREWFDTAQHIARMVLANDCERCMWGTQTGCP